MSVGVPVDDLLTYSDYERRRWHEWLAADPSRLHIPFQQGARFPTVGALFDHVFLVERRHLARLQGATPPESTGVAPGDVARLFEFGELVRADLRHFADDLDGGARETLTITLPMGVYTMTRRKLLAHILLHEIRHLAQAAYAIRLAGHASPGDHDLLFCPEVA